MPIRIRRLPGPKARKAAAFFNRNASTACYQHPLVIKDGRGCYVEDVDGNRILDFSGQIASIALGHRHPAVMSVLREYSKIGATKIAGSDYYCPEAEELIKNLLTILPKPMKRIFLVNTGSEAVENAMKLCWRVFGPRPGISFQGAFHGRTIGALSHTHSNPAYNKNFPQLDNYVVKFCTGEDGINNIDEVLAEAKTKPAFLIVEVVQGEGGYNIGHLKFIKHLRAVTKAHGIPMICDEIQSGMGRTGKWWAFQHYGIEPDLLCASKQLQVGAVAFKEEFNPLQNCAIGGTWAGGHRIDLAVGSAVIRTIKKEKLMANATRVGNHIVKRLKELTARTESISNPRGLGLMIGFDCPSNDAARALVDETFKRGLVLLTAGRNSVRISPPLVLTKTEADEGLDVIESVVSKLTKNHSRT